MSSLISISIKNKDGEFKSYTISVSDETNGFGQNVSMWIEQSKEDRDAKKKRTYVGNGKVLWTDGVIKKVVTPQSDIADAENATGNEGDKEEIKEEEPF
jgi:hypothetical protein